MAKSSGLGKGLDALFAESSVLKEMKNTDNNEETIKSIKVIDIEPNAEQARKKFDEASLKDLAQSIKTYGIIQHSWRKKMESCQNSGS